MINDTIGSDVIDALGGDDTITVTGGSDIVNGGDGNDTLIFRGGTVTFNGGFGLDTFDASLFTISVTINGFANSPNPEITIGSDFGDTLNFAGSVLGDALNGFRLFGRGGADSIFGGSGEDMIFGGTGNDSITGGPGNDTYGWNIGDGNDTHFGTGGGLDTLLFGAGIAPGDIRLESGPSDLAVVHIPSGARLVFSSQNLSSATALERISFANGSVIDLTAGYNLIGTAGADTLNGGAFNDVISGLGGADRLLGAGGDDTISGGDGDDILLGGAGADILSGDLGNDTLTGEDGDDRLTGGLGNDRLDGGNGAGDFAFYEGETQSITVDLTLGTANGAGIGNDTLVNIENIFGGLAGDTLTGSAGANTINGSNGADTISGLGGNDTLLGGLGDDTIDGGTGDDTLFGDEPFSPSQTATATGMTAAGNPLAISLTGARADPDGSTTVFGFVGSQTPGSANINIVYVIDISGSMSDSFSGIESVADLNGDGQSNTLLDGAIASFTALNSSLIGAGLGNTGRVALVVFSSSSSIVFTGTPARDTDGNGVPDVVQALRALRSGGSTFYDLGLAQAGNALSGFPAGSNYVFFTSDGEPNGGDYSDEVQTLLNTNNATIRALGLGNGASLPALDLVDDGIANNSTERVLSPSQLSAGLLAPEFDISLIDRVDISLNGRVVKSIPASSLQSTPFGL
jgi:Ca2+-binding RTX toxin-like protein